MKTFLKSILYVSLTSLILTGCANNDDFTTPDLTGCVELKTTNTIANFKKIATDKATAITGDDIIEGVVVSSDAGGSVFKEIFIVSEDGQESIRVRVDAYSTYGTYGVGQKVYIKLKGLFVQKDPIRKIVALGSDSSLAAIKDYNKYIIKGCKIISGDDFEKTFNNKVSLKEALDEKYIGKLVTIPEVQFKKEFRGKIFASNTSGDFTKVAIEGKEPLSATFYFNVSKNAKGFANEIVPDKSGTMTGIMTRYNAEYQLVPRTMHDLDLTKAPFDGNTDPVDPVDPTDVKPGKFVAFPGADFENWDNFLASIFKNALSDATAQKADGQGWENSRGLAVKGTRAANGFLFSVEKVKMPTDATKISFLMKGKAAKSLSINIYKGNGTNYYAYNLENVSVSKIVKPNMEETSFNGVPSGNTTNVYDGVIDTKGQWVKVTLDLGELKGDYHKAGTGSFIGFRSGKAGDYDLVIDEIRFEDGTPVNGGTDPVDPDPSGDFFPKNAVYAGDMRTNEAAFLATVNDRGLTKDIGAFKPGAGPDKQGALSIEIPAASSSNLIYFGLLANDATSKAKKVSFYVKGISSGSLSIGVMDSTGKEKGFNVGAISTTDVVLNSIAGTNDYKGAINTAGKWVKVTVDLTKVPGGLATSGDFIKFRVGAKYAPFDLLISSFFIE